MSPSNYIIVAMIVFMLCITNSASARYIEADPIGQQGGIDPYVYVENNPITRIDPSGLTWSSNWNFFWDWASGGGDNNRTYGPDTIETQEMRNSPGADALRNYFYNRGCRDQHDFAYGSGQAALDTLPHPSTTGAQVGGFAGASAVNNGNGTVTFTIPNTAGTRSFFYHVVPDRSGTTGPMRNINQTFQWTENINASACRCSR